MARDAVDFELRRNELPYGMHSRDEIVNYFAWQALLFKGYARGTIIDHGAGTGGLSAALLAARAGSVVAVEPDPQLVEVLHAKLDAVPEADVFQGTLDDYLAAHGRACVDAILRSAEHPCLPNMRMSARQACRSIGSSEHWW